MFTYCIPKTILETWGSALNTTVILILELERHLMNTFTAFKL